ncbi:acetyltransferase [Vibrio cholerae]|nr:acetyltransferase [Vibrio cholerae]EJL9428209.1 acetyltransferase [Vibrio cholerae]EKF9879133.1 acetyltransferase [Vibrio cholerae]
MVMVVVIEFGGMRCQPLRRALCLQRVFAKLWR